MNRRVAIAGLGSCVTGLLAGCLGDGFGSTRNTPRLVGLEAGNWHPAPQRLHVRIETETGVLYETHVQLPGGDPTEYERPPAELDGYPSALPPSATLVTWVENASRDDAQTLALGDRRTECLGVEIDICPTCATQKGEADITAPSVPDTLIKHTANCQYG